MKPKTVKFGYMHHNRLYYIAFSFNTLFCIRECAVFYNVAINHYDLIGWDSTYRKMIINSFCSVLFSFPINCNGSFYDKPPFILNIYLNWIDHGNTAKGYDMAIQLGNTTWYTTWEYNPELISWEYYCPVKGEVGPSWWRAWVWGACPAVNTWSYLWCWLWFWFFETIERSSGWATN